MAVGLSNMWQATTTIDCDLHPNLGGLSAWQRELGNQTGAPRPDVAYRSLRHRGWRILLLDTASAALSPAGCVCATQAAAHRPPAGCVCAAGSKLFFGLNRLGFGTTFGGNAFGVDGLVHSNLDHGAAWCTRQRGPR